MKTVVYAFAAILAFSGAALASDRCSSHMSYGLTVPGKSSNTHGLFIKKTSNDKSGEDRALKR